MGRNVFGLDDAISYLGVNPSPEQIATLREVPFSEEVLVFCRDTHILVAVFPLSILDIREMVRAEPTRHFCYQSWYNEQVFASDSGQIGWHLIRKTPVENSSNKMWDEQQDLLGENDETPKAQVMVYAIIGHYKATGERLFEEVWVRCSDLTLDGNRASAGRFDFRGLYVRESWDGTRDDDLGLASERKKF
jgi:hypothetical protein